MSSEKNVKIPKLPKSGVEKEERNFKNVFSLELEKFPITLIKPDDKLPWECYLQEMDGEDRDNFLQGQKGKVNFNTREVRSFKDLHTSLIARCLYDASTNELVPADQIRKFPSSVQGELYDMCVEINALKEEEEEKIKND